MRRQQPEPRMKMKEKEKESKEKAGGSGHHFAEASIEGLQRCSYCNRALGDDAFECQCCSVKVHRGCRDGLPVCSKAKLRDKYGQIRMSGSNKDIAAASSGKYGLTRGRPQSAYLAEGGARSAALHAASMRGRLPSSSSALAKSISTNQLHGAPAASDRNGFHRSRWQSTESLSLFSRLMGNSMESLPDDGDAIECSLMGGLEDDARYFEADSWSVAVDDTFIKRQNKDDIKRQDVIYELMQTEMHHIRTLRIMAEVFGRGLRQELGWTPEMVERLFPRLDDLLDVHTQFIARLLERRRHSLEPGSGCNFSVARIGDVLVAQFSEDNGDALKETYGAFCSQHCEAVRYYKESFARDRKFQSFIRRQSSNALVRRLGVQECILLVTQRITKYPVLIDRILRSTREGSVEHEELTRALATIRGVISAVDECVSEHGMRQRLIELYNRMDSKAATRLRDGAAFTRADLMAKRLVHDGTLSIRALAGRPKDILAVVFTDSLVLLQEKDQKYTFPSLEQKPAVISLQKLIVREKANEEKGLFLINASAAVPDMYEVHAASRDERQYWLALLQRTIASCPDIDEGVPSETEEDKKLTDAKRKKAREFQNRLASRDAVLRAVLEEKLKIYAEMAEYFGCEEPAPPEAAAAAAAAAAAPGPSSGAGPERTLLRLDSGALRGEPLLKKGLQEVETLQKMMASAVSCYQRHDAAAGAAHGPALPKRAETFGGFDSTLKRNDPGKDDACQGAAPAQQQELRRTESDSVIKKHRGGAGNFLRTPLDIEAMQSSIFILTQTMYSLQAVVAQQDSFIETARCRGGGGGGGGDPVSRDDDPNRTLRRPAHVVSRSDTVRERVARPGRAAAATTTAAGEEEEEEAGWSRDELAFRLLECEAECRKIKEQLQAMESGAAKHEGVEEAERQGGERRRQFTHSRQNSLPCATLLPAEPPPSLQQRRGSVGAACLALPERRPPPTLTVAGPDGGAPGGGGAAPARRPARSKCLSPPGKGLAAGTTNEEEEDDSDESKTPTNVPSSPPSSPDSKRKRDSAAAASATAAVPPDVLAEQLSALRGGARGPPASSEGGEEEEEEERRRRDGGDDDEDELYF